GRRRSALSAERNGNERVRQVIPRTRVLGAGAPARIGIRVALGASPSEVRRLVLPDGLRLTSVGLVIGFLLALAPGHLMAAALVGVVPLDIATYLFTPASLSGVALAALVATLVPAMRASSVDTRPSGATASNLLS